MKLPHMIQIVLDESSRAKLRTIAASLMPAPADARFSGDHVTLAYGEQQVARWTGPSGVRELQVTHYGMLDGNVAAFRVSGAEDSFNSAPHVTMWVKPPAVARMSNDIKDWNPIPAVQIRGYVPPVFPEHDRKEIKRALEFAKMAHAGQLRSMGPELGVDYFETHVLGVVKRCPLWAQPAAALHDVKEDTDHDPSGDKFSRLTIAAVDLLTKPEGGDYWDYLQKIITTDGQVGIIARAVKFADLCDNLRTLTGDLRPKYIRALAMVSNEIVARGEAA